MKIKRVSDAIVRSFKMRLMHVSDTHGGFPRLHGRFDCVIHSGDFFPNSHHVMQANKTREMAFQLQWLRDQIPNIKQWLGGHTMIYVPGNHDFLHQDMVEYELQSAGIKAYGIADRMLLHEGINFYGFPHVPPIDGTWNYEKHLPEMQTEVDKMVVQLNSQKVDVLICHAPMYKCLDLTYGNELTGNTVMNNAFDYQIAEAMRPNFYLCGHIHEAHGLTLRDGVLVSNAATTYQIVEV
jgi:Icc-related predicted phosphoesterase